MLNSVFAKTLRDMRGAILGFGIGLGLYGVLVVAITPSFVGTPEYQGLFQRFPESLLALYGEGVDFTTVEGYLGMSLINFAPLILAILAVGQGLGFTSGEEEKKTIDVLLANPLPRWRILLEKMASFLVASVLTLALIVAGTLGAGVIAGVEIDTVPTLQAFVNILPVTWAMAAFSAFVAAALPSRRMALFLSTFLVIGSYLLDYLGRVAEDIEPYRPLSIFYYFGGGRVFANGLSASDIGILLGLALILFLASLWAFERRDLSA